MSCEIMGRNLGEFTVNQSIEMVTSWWFSNNLAGISTRLLTTGARFVLVVLHLIVATSGPSAFAAQLISSVVTMLLLKIAQFYLACTKNVFSFPKSQLNPY